MTKLFHTNDFDRVKSVGGCCDVVRDVCVCQSPCAGCGCMSNRGGLKVRALGDAMLHGLLVPTFDLEMMQNTCKLVNECIWGDGSSIFKELNDGELAPFTVVKHEAEGEGRERVFAIGPCGHFRGVGPNVCLVPSSLPQIDQGKW